MRKALPAVLVVLLILAVLGAARAATYVPRELPGYLGITYATDINNSGRAAGISYSLADEMIHLLTWDADGTMTDLGYGLERDLNNLDQILSDTDEHGTALWKADGTWQDLPAFTGGVIPLFLNDVGQFTGWMPAGSDTSHAFIWSVSTGIMDIGTLPGDATGEPRDINNAGQVIMTSCNADRTIFRPCIWSASTGVQPLPLLTGGIMGQPYSINDKGQVVGYSWVNADTENPIFHGVLWNPDGSIVDLGTGVAYSINNKGQIVCQVDNEMYVRDPDGMLNPLPPLPGMSQPFPESINDFGLVVGECCDADGNWHATIWGPADEAIMVTLTIDPSVLNPKSKGKWVTAYIELPTDAEQTLQDIDLTSVKLQDTIAPADSPTSIGDADGDGIPDLMLKLDRAALCMALDAGAQTVKLTGQFTDGTSIAGECAVKVLGK